MSSSDVMIETSELSKRYGSVRALDKVSFEVNRGEVVGFLGPNGAGKSTTMRILTCFISATSGTARVHGFDCFEEPLEVRRKLGYLPQRAPLYGEMNVWEYLSFVADMRGLDGATFKRRMKNIVEICGLAQSLGKDIRALSHGYRQRVGLAQALVHNPPILILDEPTSDLDPNEKAEVIRYIKEIGKERTILLSTHNLSEVEAACARAIIVSKGRVVADGPLDDIRVSKSGQVRYIVTIHEKRVLDGGPAKKAPSAQEVQEAFEQLPGIGAVSELPTDETVHSFQLLGASGGDIRPEIFAMIVQKGWLLMELRREARSLEDVFKALTKGDEAKDRGRVVAEEDEAGDEEEDEEDDASEDEEDESDDDASDEEDDESEDEEDDEEEASDSDKKGKKD